MREIYFLSIIIPSYNRAAQLERQLYWLMAQSIDRHNSELIVVDDGSTDGTWELLQTTEDPHDWLKPMRQQNQGQAAARQLGVSASRGQILLFIDDDMEPVSADFLEKHRSFHQRALVPTVVLGAILPPLGTKHRPAFEYFYEKSIRGIYEDFDRGLLRPSGKHFFSANVSLPKLLFEAVGGFASQYRHAEDRELGLRLEMQAGARFHFLPEAAAFHHSPTGRYSAFIQRAELYGRYDLKMAQLYPERTDLRPEVIFVAPHPIKRFLAHAVLSMPAWPLLFNKAFALAAEACNRMGLLRPAIGLCSVLYTINYVRGFCLETRAQESKLREV